MCFKALYGHGKYGFTPNEKIWSFIFNGISTLTLFPVPIYLFRKGKYFWAFIGFFTVISSFMYHFIESLNLLEFILLEGSWHRFDNIGVITSFMIL